MSNSKKHVLSIVKSKKNLGGKEYSYFTLLCDGDYRIGGWSETFIVLYAINLYFDMDCYELDDTLSDIAGDIISICIDKLFVLPYNEETI